MGSFRDVLGDLAGQAVRAAVSDGFPRFNGHGGSPISRIEGLCKELGWSIDERISSTGLVLHFNDPLVRVRKVIISCGASHFVNFSTSSTAVLPHTRVEPPLIGYLLHQNSELTIPAWQMSVLRNEDVCFTLSYCALLNGLTADVIRVLCENMVREAKAFDQKLREYGLL